LTLRVNSPCACSGNGAIDENTTFRIASLSKGMTATVVAQLLREQRLDLDMPVSDFSPELLLSSPDATQALPLEHLLSHRTGLPPNAYDNLLEAGIPPVKIRQRYPEVDQSWHSVAVKEAYYNIPAAGGVNASVTDMAHWLRAQMGYEPSIIAPETLEVLHTPRVKTRAELRRTKRHMKALEETYYGLGWRIYRYSGQLLISHFGGVDNGYLAQIAFLPELDVGIVTLTNSPSKNFFRILPAFLNEELGL